MKKLNVQVFASKGTNMGLEYTLNEAITSAAEDGWELVQVVANAYFVFLIYQTEES